MSFKSKISIIGAAVLFIIFIIFIFSAFNKPKDKTVSIGNLGSCAKNINPQVKENLNIQIYPYIKAANDYNHATNKSGYKATIRKDSCFKLGDTVSANNTTTSSSAIIDIPEAKQSWQISWSWIPRSQTLATDIGAADVECLPKNKLIYGDFHCDNVLSQIKYGTPYYDPILKYVPYKGSSFNLSYDPAKKAVTVTVLVPAIWSSDPEVVKNIESSVPEWFTQNGLDINNYTVSYVVEPQ